MSTLIFGVWVSLTIVESLSTSCIAAMISWSRSLADLRAVWDAVTKPLHSSPPHIGAPSSPVQPIPPQGEPEQPSPSAAPPQVCRDRIFARFNWTLGTTNSWKVTGVPGFSAQSLSHLLTERCQVELIQLFWQFVQFLLISLVFAIKLFFTVAHFFLCGLAWCCWLLQGASWTASGSVNATLCHCWQCMCGWNCVQGTWKYVCVCVNIYTVYIGNCLP